MRKLALALALLCGGCICYSRKPLTALEKTGWLDDELTPIAEQCDASGHADGAIAVCEESGHRFVWLSRRRGFEDLFSAWDLDGGAMVFSETRYWSDTCLLPPQVKAYGHKPPCKPKWQPACTGLAAVREMRGHR